MEGWDAPFDTQSEDSPRVLLARRIAAQVKLWMARGLKAGDVLVLVRQRGPLFEAIIRALKDSEIPVAGADRLVLTEHIAVMDLMALADALLLEDDDLRFGQRASLPAVWIERRATVYAGLESQGLVARQFARPCGFRSDRTSA